MYVIVWKYLVKRESLEAFLAAYGPNGEWAVLFSRSRDFLGVDLIEGEVPDTYLTVDRWVSRESFALHMSDIRDEYEQLDRRLDALTVSEELTLRGYHVDTNGN